MNEGEKGERGRDVEKERKRGEEQRGMQRKLRAKGRREGRERCKTGNGELVRIAREKGNGACMDKNCRSVVDGRERKK